MLTGYLSYLIEMCDERAEGLERECCSTIAEVFAQLVSSAGVPVRQIPIAFSYVTLVVG